MAKDKLVPFSIDHLDPLGQGVSKLDESITFISKTLPEETGQAFVRKSAKGVNFAQINYVQQKSQDRISPDCEHFEECGGCQYLHTTYEKELQFKELALKKHLAKLCPDTSISVHRASQRFNYRNRIQLHYKNDQIGFKKPFSNEILPIKDCLLANSKVRSELVKVVNQFQVTRPLDSKSGHVEIYEFQNQVQVHWNKNYAHGGFTQVNTQMHHNFKQFLENYAKEQELQNKIIWDIFGGDGNLGLSLNPKEHHVVDSVTHNDPKDGQKFYQLNLFKDDGQKKCLDLIQQFSPDIMLLDPPRAGFKQVSDFVTQANPDVLFAVSCHPSILSRDFQKSYGDLKLSQIHLFDFFPGTYHFETLIIYSK